MVSRLICCKCSCYVAYAFRDGQPLKHFKVEVFFCADYGFTSEWLGISPSAHSFCVWCKMLRPFIAQLEREFPTRSIDTMMAGKDGVQVCYLFDRLIVSMIPLQGLLTWTTIWCARFTCLDPSLNGSS